MCFNYHPNCLDIQYDEFGSRTYFAYGNGTSSTYTYDANSRRLLNLVSTTGNGDMLDLTYTYDDVGNITRINNTATGVNGLGGNYTYTYVYDGLYRLIDSDGNTGSGAGYELLMTYSPSGNIISKTLTATKEILGNTQVVNYANDYTYNNAHMVSMVNDINGTVPPLDFQFDGAGNMTLQSVPDPNMGRHERLLCWDEENRLSATRDQYYATANMYDASGNRAWKLGGEVNWMWNNGQGWQAYGDLNLRTWYQSDLVTITDQAMTKHYFIAGQRIASKLAESLSPEVAQNLKDKPVTPLSGDVNELGTNMTERLRRDFECVGLDYNAFYPGEIRLEAIENLLNAPEQPDEYQVFFYHSDHLGSSSFITDINGDATQHLQYLPFGEDFVHQQNTAAYYAPYTFSGKERDVETSLSYFGARYYEAGLSVWLSVDPMSDERPSLSPYNYCQWNPIKRIDPNGLLDQEASQNGGDPKPQPIPTHPTLPNLNPGSGSKNTTPSFPQRVQSMQTERTASPSTPLQTAGSTALAIGVVTDGAGLALTNVNAKNISYTAPSGTTANVAKSTVTNTFKAISTGTFVASVMIDVAQTLSGETTPGRFVSNTLIGAGAIALGGAPGLALTLGYGTLSMSGMLNGPKGPAQPMAPTLMSLPDATSVSSNFVMPKIK